MKSWIVHYKNKYPGGRVVASETSIDVYDAAGAHCVALRKDGSGSWVDFSGEYGCKACHCLEPIPKDARIFKVKADGKIGEDELAAERKNLLKQFVYDGKVQSIGELSKIGFRFDEKQRVLSKPEVVKAPEIEEPSASQSSVVAGGQDQGQNPPQ